MVKTAETYVVSGAVAGDDPLRAFHDEVLESHDAVADLAAASLAEGYEGLEHFACGLGVVAVVEPFACLLLDGVGACGALCGALHKVGKTELHLLVGDTHTQTELGEVLEQGVCPCGTVAAEVGGVGGRGHRT